MDFPLLNTLRDVFMEMNKDEANSWLIFYFPMYHHNHLCHVESIHEMFNYIV
jgi:hypothetical protein